MEYVKVQIIVICVAAGLFCNHQYLEFSNGGQE